MSNCRMSRNKQNFLRSQEATLVSLPQRIFQNLINTVQMQNVCTDIPRTCICVPQGCFLVDCSKEGGGEIFWLAVGGGGTGGNCPSFIKEIRWSSQKCFSPAASVFENSTYLSGPTNPSFFFLGLITFLSERKLSMFKDFASVSQ